VNQSKAKKIQQGFETLEGILMVTFNDSESIEEFKHRINFLTEKLNKTNKKIGQDSNRIVTVV
jgi:hypothetical protein